MTICTSAKRNYHPHPFPPTTQGTRKMSSSSLQEKQATIEDNQRSGNRKTATTSSTRPQEQALKCPRCDSPNTKFCYYNNYSLTQPRHFCKTCRRYWTKGGALRNVPIGGGCQKNKKTKSSSRLSRDSSGSSEMGGFNILRGLSPARDFNLGGLSFPRINPSTSGLHDRFCSFGDVAVATSPAAASATSTSPSCFSLDPSGSSAASMMGFSYPISSTTSGFSAAIQEVGADASINVHSSLASSIDSLSSINQDLHWKLQQQRLAMVFGEEIQKESTAVCSVPIGIQAKRPQPILFQNLEISKPEAASGSGFGNSRKEGGSGDDTATEWFFGNSCCEVTATPTDSSSNANDHNTGNWTKVQAWGYLHQYKALP